MKEFFNNVYKVLIEKRTDFSGRASRNEYWSSWLFIQLTSIFLLTLSFRARPLLLIFILFSILIIIPSLAVTTRRLHDVNKSGYWLIVPLPLIFTSYLSLFLLSLFSPENQSEGLNFFQIASIVTYITGIFMASLWYCFPIFMFLTQKGDIETNKYGDPN